MDFDETYVVTDRLVTSSAAEVADAERALGCRFPTGYSEYVQRFGAGSLSDLLRVYPPERIVASVAEWRESKNEDWFWDAPASAVDQARVKASVPLADTENGDELCFHPEDPESVIVLPRDGNRSYAVGPGLHGAIDWVFRSGVLQRPGAATAFDSGVGRRYVRHQTQRGRDLSSVLDALLAVGTHARVDELTDDHTVVYFPSIKGRVVLMRFGTGEVDALIVHDEAAPAELLMPIQGALEQAGASLSGSWG